MKNPTLFKKHTCVWIIHIRYDPVSFWARESADSQSGHGHCGSCWVDHEDGNVPLRSVTDGQNSSGSPGDPEPTKLSAAEHRDCLVTVLIRVAL